MSRNNQAVAVLSWGWNRARKRPRWFVIALTVAGFALFLRETRTSFLQAKLLSTIAGSLSYNVHRGPSTRIVFPESGPFNVRRGYTALPAFEDRLAKEGFNVAAQSVFSPELKFFAGLGVTPPFRDPVVNGLMIRGTDEQVLYSASSAHMFFTSYEQVPPLVAKALLFVENRELEKEDPPTRNPVVDWGRSGKAVLSLVADKIGFSVRREGGSTLATQIEKFRYSKDGRTGSLSDKLRQMLSASIRSYRHGTDTRSERRQIILDYLNSVPLSAAGRFGEVNGFGEGLYAWFGVDLDQFIEDMDEHSPDDVRQKAFKRAMALIGATRAPTSYLIGDHAGLEARANFYIRQMKSEGILPAAFAEGAAQTQLEFPQLPPSPPPMLYAKWTAATAIRNHLRSMLEVPDFYALDRLHLEVRTTLDTDVQYKAGQLLESFQDKTFVNANGLRQKRLLLHGDPAAVNYSFTLFERTKGGNLLRAQIDTLKKPFDLNEGMKAELGSTAKLRTLAHYLELVALLHEEFRNLSAAEMTLQTLRATDPITLWVAETMSSDRTIDLSTLLDKALDRQYSSSSGEVFFTGGGVHWFSNFESSVGYNATYTLRDGLKHSVNLVYIRLMRDLVQFHQSRLGYDPVSILNQPDNPVRQRMLQEIADNESRLYLAAAYRAYQGLTESAVVERILGIRTSRPATLRKLSILYLAWFPKADAQALKGWVGKFGFPITDLDAGRLFKSYDPSRLNLNDYGYLLRLHPMDVWCAGELVRDPGVQWEDVLKRSAEARALSSLWLFKTKNIHAQDRRLRIRFEEEAFKRMTPYWQRLGFPFDELVPSLATAIGSSADRPIALADLMGTILNDGVRLPVLRFEVLEFAKGTPYETEFRPVGSPGNRVMQVPVARALRRVLAGVVEEGTARSLNGVFTGKDKKPLVIGGKTGSGDNRFGRKGVARAVSRTGTFVFFIEDRFFGVLTAYVEGKQADRYSFTSALPVAALRLLAPAIETELTGNLVSSRPNREPISVSTPTVHPEAGISSDESGTLSEPMQPFLQELPVVDEPPKQDPGEPPVDQPVEQTPKEGPNPGEPPRQEPPDPTPPAEPSALPADKPQVEQPPPERPKI